MAKANLNTFPSTVRKISESYRTSPEVKDEKQEGTIPCSTDDITTQSHLIAGDTLSDWRRKSTIITPPNYPSEHRRDQRQASRLNIQVYRQGKTLGTTRTYDVNSRGISVECGKLDLHKGEVVEIDLPENAVPDGMRPHVCCLVIHTGEQCGLMLLDPEDR